LADYGSSAAARPCIVEQRSQSVVITMKKRNSHAYQHAVSAEPELPVEVVARVLGKLGAQIDPST
jgi:hypothetical protein